VAAGDDHAIRLISLAGEQSPQVLFAHHDWVQCVEFSPGGRMVASCGHDGQLRVWLLPDGQSPMRELMQHQVNHALFAIAFASDRELYAVGYSNAVYRLDISEDRWDVDHQADCRDLRTLACSHDGRWLAYGGRDGMIQLRSLLSDSHALASHVSPPPSPSILVSPNLHFARIRSLCFSEDGQSILSVGEDRRLVRWDIATRQVIGQMEVPAGKLRSVIPLRGDLVAVAGSDNTIRVVDLGRNAIVSKWVGHDGSIAVLRRSATHVFSGAFDTSVRTWNIEEALHRSDDSGRFVHPVAAQFEDSSAQERIR